MDRSARRISITLLTNRTWPDCQNQAIKQVRPAFHNAVIEALEKKKAKMKRRTTSADLRHLATEEPNRCLR